MKLSIHQIIRGKPASVQDINGFNYMESCGQRVNLGYGWINIDAEWPDVFELITKDGCATSAELAGDHRNDENFISRELLMVDIDSGMTIQELLDDNFYNAFGAGFYTTPSHTMDNHRFRIMFRTETPILNSDCVKKLIMALMRVYDHADVACKDSTRIFYGTPNCVLCERTDNILSDELVDRLVEMEETFRLQNAPVATTFDVANYTPKTVEDITVLLDELRKHYADLEHNDRLSVVWAIMSEGIAGADTIALMRQRWSDADKTRKYESMTSGRTRSDITLGTIYHMIRKYDPTYKREREFNNESPTKQSIKTLRQKLKEMH